MLLGVVVCPLLLTMVDVLLVVLLFMLLVVLSLVVFRCCWLRYAEVAFVFAYWR